MRGARPEALLDPPVREPAPGSCRSADLLPAHNAELLHQEPDERLLLLRRGALDEPLEVLAHSATSSAEGAAESPSGPVWTIVRSSASRASTLSRRRAMLLAVCSRHDPLLESTEVPIQGPPGTRELLLNRLEPPVRLLGGSDFLRSRQGEGIAHESGVGEHLCHLSHDGVLERLHG